jgi:hypothetical protein
MEPCFSEDFHANPGNVSTEKKKWQKKLVHTLAAFKVLNKPIIFI